MSASALTRNSIMPFSFEPRAMFQLTARIAVFPASQLVPPSMFGLSKAAETSRESCKAVLPCSAKTAFRGQESSSFFQKNPRSYLSFISRFYVGRLIGCSCLALRHSAHH
jgi:hypothetical protein